MEIDPKKRRKKRNFFFWKFFKNQRPFWTQNLPLIQSGIDRDAVFNSAIVALDYGSSKCEFGGLLVHNFEDPFLCFKKYRKNLFFSMFHMKLRSSYFLAHTRRHCGTMAHFLDKWAEWVQWADCVDAVKQTFSFQRFLSCWKIEKYFFFVCSWPVRHKKVLSHFQHTESFERGTEMHLCLCNCIHPVSPLHPFRPFHPFRPIAHCTHCTQSPIAPIAPNRPLHPLHPVAHCIHSAQSPIYGEVGYDAAVAPRTGEKVTWAQLYRCMLTFSNFFKFSRLIVFNLLRKIKCYLICFWCEKWQNLKLLTVLIFLGNTLCMRSWHNTA